VAGATVSQGVVQPVGHVGLLRAVVYSILVEILYDSIAANLTRFAKACQHADEQVGA
jgi:hypothetical protein